VTQPLSPSEVFVQLLQGVCDRRWEDVTALYAEHTDVIHPLDPFRAPAMLSREELREHFSTIGDTLGDLHFRPANITIHQTADPEVIVGEFEYLVKAPGAEEPFARPGIFVMRVRDGQIVSSRDYVDHLGMARLLGRLDDLVTALK